MSEVNMLDGYKTYIASAISVIWAIYGALSGHLDQGAASQIISTSAVAASLRRAISQAAK